MTGLFSVSCLIVWRDTQRSAPMHTGWLARRANGELSKLHVAAMTNRPIVCAHTRTFLEACKFGLLTLAFAR
ncbi:hypothetical protein BX592_103338 [Paraburkholderia rhizosphaerae]|uniref:Uncharacterized protein n=1 Tax=Paraburkholderia rhizosphaerae TaxID=480658 RepID=A0A4V3HFK9_9BURK|nr:hypothetical protein BX592_103338 [Paraburkholderia rhizosphaerae]